eukprot:7767761-Pyramimonas_sp.AAC.1
MCVSRRSPQQFAREASLRPVWGGVAHGGIQVWIGFGKVPPRWGETNVEVGMFINYNHSALAVIGTGGPVKRSMTQMVKPGTPRLSLDDYLSIRKFPDSDPPGSTAR